MYVNAQTPFSSDMPVGRAGVVSIPMNKGGILGTDRYFDPVYSASSSLPMEWSEFSAVIEEINGACSSAFPKWQRVLPCGMTACGWVMGVLGTFLMAMTSGATGGGPNPLAMFVVLAGFLLFSGGGFGTVCCLSKGSAKVASKLRLKLSELNARYAEKGIDLQLHESRHLEMYNRTSSDHHSDGMAVRTVTRYTLVVQVLGSSGQGAIPSPELIVAQALRGASAPPMQAEMQP